MLHRKNEINLLVVLCVHFPLKLISETIPNWIRGILHLANKTLLFSLPICNVCKLLVNSNVMSYKQKDTIVFE